MHIDANLESSAIIGLYVHQQKESGSVCMPTAKYCAF
jgi:hypothetical protein